MIQLKILLIRYVPKNSKQGKERGKDYRFFKEILLDVRHIIGYVMHWMCIVLFSGNMVV
jgi:hypothetical protein